MNPGNRTADEAAFFFCGKVFTVGRRRRKTITPTCVHISLNNVGTYLWMLLIHFPAGSEVGINMFHAFNWVGQGSVVAL